jgi:hypothetical protein
MSSICRIGKSIWWGLTWDVSSLLETPEGAVPFLWNSAGVNFSLSEIE